MNGQAEFNRRLARLLMFKEKVDFPDDMVSRLITSAIVVDSKLNGLSVKEMHDLIISWENKAEVASGLLVLALQSNEKDQVKKYFTLMTAMGDQLYAAMCNMNMIILELFPRLQESCRDNFLIIFRETINLNLAKIENVILNFVKTLVGGTDASSRTRLVREIAKIYADNPKWIMQPKTSVLMQYSVLTFGHFINDLAVVPGADSSRNFLIETTISIIRNRFVDMLSLGREFFFMLLRLAKVPQFTTLIKELVQKPDTFGIKNIDTLVFRPPGLYALNRLSPDLTKKLEYVINNCQLKPNFTDKHIEWIAKTFLRGFDAFSIRVLIIRYLLYFVHLNNNVSQHAVETRNILLAHFLQMKNQNESEFATLKLALWLDWVTYEPSCVVSVTDSILSLLRYCFSLQHMYTLGNQVMEFGARDIFLVQTINMFPGIAEKMKAASNEAMKALSDFYGQTGLSLSPVLENGRMDRGVRECARALWPDFMKPPISSAPALPVPATPTDNNQVQRMNRPVEKPAGSKEKDAKDDIIVIENNGKYRSRSPSPPGSTSRKMSEEDERDVESAYNMLRDDVKPIIANLRSAFCSEESDESEKGEAVQRLLQMLLGDDGPDEEQLEFIGQCLHGIMGRPTDIGSNLVKEENDDYSEESVADVQNHPLFIIFRNIYFTPANDSTSRAPLVTIIASMRDRDPSISYLLLFFIKGNQTTNTKRDQIRGYEEVARACDKEVYEMLAEDLKNMRYEDDLLFEYVAPGILEIFPPEVVGTVEIVEQIVKLLDHKQINRLIGSIIREGCLIFRKDSIASIVTASLEWDYHSQLLLWELMHAEGVQVDWLLSVIPKIKKTDSVAISNIMIMIRKNDREPSMSVLRSILSRPPDPDERLTVQALKLLIDDSDMCQRVGELLGQLMKKQLSNGDLVMSSVAKAQGKKGPSRLALEQVLSHLEQFVKLCCSKDGKSGESLLSSRQVQDAFSSIESAEKAAFLKPKFASLFALIGVLGEDSPTSGSRTLRGNRGAASSSQKAQKRRERDEDLSDDFSSSSGRQKKRQIYIDDSDSD